MLSNVGEKFYCKECDYTGSCLSNWSKHLLTRKHTNRINRTNLLEKLYACKKCNKEYSARNSLWYHESKCEYKEPDYKEPDYNSIIHKLLADNIELRNFIIEQASEHKKTQRIL